MKAALPENFFPPDFWVVALTSLNERNLSPLQTLRKEWMGADPLGRGPRQGLEICGYSESPANVGAILQKMRILTAGGQGL